MSYISLARAASVLVGFVLGAAPAGARAADSVVKVGSAAPQTAGTGHPGDGNAPIATDSRPATGGPTNAGTTGGVLHDVSYTYEHMEKSIELQFAKLLREAKNNKEALEAQIKALDHAIEQLKQQAKKIQLSLQTMEQQAARKQAESQIEAINSKIDSMQKQKKALLDKIAAIEKQIDQLRKEHDKALAELKAQEERKKKQKTLAGGRNPPNSGVIRASTPASAQKKP